MIETVAAAFLFGLAGSTHCLSMCGGIAIAVSAGSDRPNRWFAVSYNLGRLCCYVLLGAVVGAMGSLLAISDIIGVSLRLFAALLLIGMGVYLLGFKQVLGWLESLGARAIWRPIQPLAKRMLPINSHARSWIAGSLWGLLPCGLVYTALGWATASASVPVAMLSMLAFGLGTLPAMLGVSLLGDIGRWFQRITIRRVFAIILILFGTFNAYQQVAKIVIGTGTSATSSHHHHH